MPPEPDHDAARLHQPVLLAATVAQLKPRADAWFLDCTCGLGGHSAALLAAGANVVGVDRDPAARALAQSRLAAYGARFESVAGTFAEAAEQFASDGRRFAGVLADLGVSSLQLDDGERGFSISSAAPADMRMGDGCPDTALTLIDRLTEDTLANIIYQYGEDRLSRRIARALKRERAAGRLASAADLAAVVRSTVPGHQPRHPALRTFQALRIAVNDELGELERLLATLPKVLDDEGVAVVISFHSLEDRMVKQAFRAGREAGSWSDIARKPVIAEDDELALNPRAHSAKLRWAVRAGRSAP